MSSMQIFPLNLLIELLLLGFIWEYGSYIHDDFMIDLSVTMTGIHLSFSLAIHCRLVISVINSIVDEDELFHGSWWF